MQNDKVNILVTAEDATGPGLTAAGAQLDTLGGKIKTLGSGFSNLASAMAPLGIAATAALGFSVKAAISFQQSMELVHTQAGATQQEVTNLSNAVLKLAPSVGQGPNALAQALFKDSKVGESANVMQTAVLPALGRFRAEITPRSSTGQTYMGITANISGDDWSY